MSPMLRGEGSLAPSRPLLTPPRAGREAPGAVWWGAGLTVARDAGAGVPRDIRPERSGAGWTALSGEGLLLRFGRERPPVLVSVSGLPAPSARSWALRHKAPTALPGETRGLRPHLSLPRPEDHAPSPPA